MTVPRIAVPNKPYPYGADNLETATNRQTKSPD